MNYETLATEITTDPESIGYAPFVSTGDDIGVADLLNAPRVDVPSPFYVNARTILATCGITEGSALLTAIQSTMPIIFSLLMQAGNNDGTAGGVDISLDETKTQIDQLVLAGVLSSEHGDELKALGYKKVSRAEILGLGGVHHLDVARALRGESL